jgi:hypothetical protein
MSLQHKLRVHDRRAERWSESESKEFLSKIFLQRSERRSPLSKNASDTRSPGRRASCAVEREGYQQFMTFGT